MSSLVGAAESISQQIPVDVAFRYTIILMILSLILLFLLVFTLRH